MPVTDAVHREAPEGFLVGVLPWEVPTALEQVAEVAKVRGGGGGGVGLSGGSFGGFGDEGKVFCAAACRQVEMPTCLMCILYPSSTAIARLHQID